MRELLFRGKSIYADTPNTPGYWLEGGLVYTTTASHIVEKADQIEVWLDENTEIWPQTLGQYIGLKDADGRKIFEGDILESPVVHFNSKLTRRIIVTDIRECKFMSLYVNEYRIVGNVHDNPELLEVKYDE